MVLYEICNTKTGDCFFVSDYEQYIPELQSGAMYIVSVDEIPVLEK